jgi:hypothetical protein
MVWVRKDEVPEVGWEPVGSNWWWGHAARVGWFPSCGGWTLIQPGLPMVGECKGDVWDMWPVVEQSRHDGRLLIVRESAHRGCSLGHGDAWLKVMQIQQWKRQRQSRFWFAIGKGMCDCPIAIHLSMQLLTRSMISWFFLTKLNHMPTEGQTLSHTANLNLSQ